MAIIIREGEWYVVMVNGQMLGQFAKLLDAHCFALQLLEREMASSVQLLSGVIVT